MCKTGVILINYDETGLFLIKGGDQAICDFRVYDIGERTAQPPEAQNTQVWYQNKGMVILF